MFEIGDLVISNYKYDRSAGSIGIIKQIRNEGSEEHREYLVDFGEGFVGHRGSHEKTAKDILSKPTGWYVGEKNIEKVADKNKDPLDLLIQGKINDEQYNMLINNS